MIHEAIKTTPIIAEKKAHVLLLMKQLTLETQTTPTVNKNKNMHQKHNMREFSYMEITINSFLNSLTLQILDIEIIQFI